MPADVHEATGQVSQIRVAPTDTTVSRGTPRSSGSIAANRSPEQEKRRCGRPSPVPVGGGRGQDRIVDLPHLAGKLQSPTLVSPQTNTQGPATSLGPRKSCTTWQYQGVHRARDT